MVDATAAGNVAIGSFPLFCQIDVNSANNRALSPIILAYSLQVGYAQSKTRASTSVTCMYSPPLRACAGRLRRAGQVGKSQGTCM